LSVLPELVQKSGATRVLVRGGAHLSIAFALGAALPDTATWPVRVLDQFGNYWGEGEGNPQELQVATDSSDAPGRPAVFVDLVPSAEPADTFGRFVSCGQFESSTRISLSGRPVLDPLRGEATARSITEAIRNVAYQAGTNRVALFLRCPFPVSVLLGRHLNTLRLDLYEWDGTADPPNYVRAVSVASGQGGSPIVDIHQREPEES
jgi:hypothetical protein